MLMDIDSIRLIFFFVLILLLCICSVLVHIRNSKKKFVDTLGIDYDLVAGDVAVLYERKMHSRKALGGLTGILIRKGVVCSDNELKKARYFFSKYYKTFEISTLMSLVANYLSDLETNDSFEQLCKWTNEEFSMEDKKKIMGFFFELAVTYGITVDAWHFILTLLDMINLPQDFCTKKIKSFSSYVVYDDDMSLDDCYKLLSIDKDANIEDVIASYNKLIKDNNPDSADDEKKKFLFATNYRKITIAYNLVDKSMN